MPVCSMKAAWHCLVCSVSPVAHTYVLSSGHHAAAAVWHSRMVRSTWNAGTFNRSRAHALMSRKLSTSAVLYGILIFFFIIFVNLR